MPRARSTLPFVRRRPLGEVHGRARLVAVSEHDLDVRVWRGPVPARGQTEPSQELRRFHRRVGGFDREGELVRACVRL